MRILLEVTIIMKSIKETDDRKNIFIYNYSFSLAQEPFEKS